MSKSTCWCGGKIGPRESFSTNNEDVICLDSFQHDPLATGVPDKITKIYIAGPMSGYPQNNYPAFDASASALRSLGYEVVSPAEFGVPDGTRVHYVDLIREDLRLMLDCHAVATLENWWESTGARNEVQVAGVLKMPIRTVDEWAAMALLPTPMKENR